MALGIRFITFWDLGFRFPDMLQAILDLDNCKADPTCLPVPMTGKGKRHGSLHHTRLSAKLCKDAGTFHRLRSGRFVEFQVEHSKVQTLRLQR